MPQNLLKQESLYLPLFKLDKEFQEDNVDISIFDSYKDETDSHKDYWLDHNHGSTVWDFSLIENPVIRLEYKFFIQDKVQKGQKLGTLVLYRRMESLLFEFLNTNYTNNESITDVSDEDYYQFLFKRNVPKDHKTTKLTKEMKTAEVISTKPQYLIIQRIKSFIDEFNDRNIPETQKDIWSIDRLPFKVNKTDCDHIRTLNFTPIKQEQIKKSVKFYTEQRLITKDLTTVVQNLCTLCQFFTFINESFPAVEKLSDLTREMIERYIAFLRTSARNENYIAAHLGTLSTFFDHIILYEDIEDVPDYCLIMPSDYKQRNNQDVRFFTDNEMKQIFAHIDELDEQIARMLYIHASSGMRISELCLLKPSQLIQTGENSYYVNVYQNKTKAENRLPVQKLCYEILQKAYKVSCEKYGNDTVYIFAKSKTKPIRPRTYSEALNWMSYNNDLRFDDGTPLHITSHTFRATLATKLVNLGFDVDITNKILGHAAKTSIKSYIAITTDDYIKYLDKQLKRQSAFISNIGNKERPSITKEESVVALDNGFCSKAGKICENANACLSCSLFVPNKKHLNKYKTQLQSVEQNIYMCEKNNLKKELEFNLEQKRILEKIINHLQEER